MVSLRVFADDLSSAVAARVTARGGSGPAHPASEAEAEAYAYVRDAFTLLDGSGRRLTLHWEGWHRTGDLVWITLRADAPGGLRDMRVGDGILFDRYDDQVNIVRATYGGHTTSLLFVPGDSPKALSFGS